MSSVECEELLDMTGGSISGNGCGGVFCAYGASNNTLEWRNVSGLGNNLLDAEESMLRLYGLYAGCC
jgi:hypothetical protein